LHFEKLMVDCVFRGRAASAMVEGAQWLESGLGLGNDAVEAIGARGDQAFQKFDREVRHIAGDDQIPVVSSHAERGEHAAERAASRNQIGMIRRADQDRGAAGRGAHTGGDLFHHGSAVQGQGGFIASHSGASSARQHVAADLFVRAAPGHEKMIAYVQRVEGHIVARNKKVYICLLMASAMLAASPAVVAADSTVEPTQRKTIVVRADPRSGRLVRGVVLTSKPVGVKIPTPAAVDIGELVEQSARKHDVDPLLVHSMIKVESNYNSRAVSNKGAEGLMQLMPPTARMLGVSDSFDPGQNIEAGVKYLAYLKSVYKDDRLALAAYNAGPGAVKKYNWIPPYPETQNYVYQVGKQYGEARRAATAKAPAPAPVTAPASGEPKYQKLEHFIDEDGRLHLRTTP
jgi:hypothetical protein